MSTQEALHLYCVEVWGLGCEGGVGVLGLRVWSSRVKGLGVLIFEIEGFVEKESQRNEVVEITLSASFRIPFFAFAGCVN